MLIVFAGNNPTGCIGLLTLAALGHTIKVVTRDIPLINLGFRFGMSIEASIDKVNFSDFDLFVNVHGREIVPMTKLNQTQYGGINVHPCLSDFKGADPIGRFLLSDKTKASVGVHRMTERVDEGEVLCEYFVDTSGCKTREEVYSKLYPFYSISLMEGLQCVSNGNKSMSSMKISV